MDPYTSQHQVDRHSWGALLQERLRQVQGGEQLADGGNELLELGVIRIGQVRSRPPANPAGETEIAPKVSCCESRSTPAASPVKLGHDLQVTHCQCCQGD